MRIRRFPLKNKDQTARVMYKIARTMAHDLDKFSIDGKPLSRFSLAEIFDYIKTIPYRTDPRPREIVARPEHLIRHQNAGLDCKKKAILLGSWAARNRIPFRYVATSKKPNRKVHHVFPQLKISGRYIDTDPTYPYNHINHRRRITNLVHLKG